MGEVMSEEGLTEYVALKRRLETMGCIDEKDYALRRRLETIRALDDKDHAQKRKLKTILKQ